eukprot:241603_1
MLTAFLVSFAIAITYSVKIDVIFETDPSNGNSNHANHCTMKLVISDVEPSSLTFNLERHPQMLLNIVQDGKTESRFYTIASYNSYKKLLIFKPNDLMADTLYLKTKEFASAINDGFVQYLDQDTLTMKSIKPLRTKRMFTTKRLGITIKSKKMDKRAARIAPKIVTIEDIFKNIHKESVPTKQGIRIKGFDKEGAAVEAKWYVGDSKPRIFIKPTKMDEWKEYKLHAIEHIVNECTFLALPYEYIFKAKEGTSMFTWQASELLKVCEEERFAVKRGPMRKLTVITGKPDPWIMEESESDSLFEARRSYRNVYDDYYNELSRLLRYYRSLKHMH